MTFYDKLIEASKEGILILVKWIFISVAMYYTFNYSMQTRDMAVNGHNAAAAINKYIEKGWLPQITNGVVPDKPTEVKTNESKTSEDTGSKG